MGTAFLSPSKHFKVTRSHSRHAGRRSPPPNRIMKKFIHPKRFAKNVHLQIIDCLMYLISSIINKKQRETWLWYPQHSVFSHYLLILNKHHYRREQLCNGKSQLKPPKDSFSLVVSWNILYLYIVKRHHQYVLGWWYAWFVSITTLAGIRDILSLYLFHRSGVSAGSERKIRDNNERDRLHCNDALLFVVGRKESCK